MYHNDRRELVYSPSDLIRFMESPFASWMDRLHLERRGELTPDVQTDEQKLIAETGNKHEARYLETLHEASRDVCIIDPDGSDPAGETKRAIADGREIIYQAALAMPPFAGYADFLMRSGEGSGSAHYEVWDTKLSLKTKPYFVIQLCCYAEMLEQIQGVRPESVGVVLGDMNTVTYRTEDHFYFYQQLKAAFLRLMEKFDPDGPRPVPEPRADHGRWKSYADQWLEENDHLALVATIRKDQIRKLNENGIHTVEELAATKKKHIPRINDEVFRRLAGQASMQLRTRKLREAEGPDAVAAFELLPPDAEDTRRGLALLPPPSPGDVYFDIEGFPLIEGGLEYLLGAVLVEAEKPVFRDWWAHSRAEEKKSFEDFVDWVHGRWSEDPSMHIYHYAPYERSALRRLAQKHGTREDQVDDLLRNDVLVDLYQIVRHAILLGEPSYSLKSVEQLYQRKREGDVKDATGSIVYYAWWMESGEPSDWEKSDILKKIRDYNEEDCVSTWNLANWLRERKAEAGVPGKTLVGRHADGEEVAAIEEESPFKLSDDAIRRRDLAESIIREIPDPSEGQDAEPDDHRVPRLLSYLVEFHRRENKPLWWRIFDCQGMSDLELSEDHECLAGLERTAEPPEPIARSMDYSYTFNPEQNTKLNAEDNYLAVLRQPPLTVVTVSKFDPEGRVQLKISNNKLAGLNPSDLPRMTSLIPYEFVRPEPIPTAIEGVVNAWADGGDLPEALRRFLHREPPNIEGHTSGQALVNTGEDPVAACIRIAGTMEESALCIQGPPGTGKTYTASRMIQDLLEKGYRIGITSNSHKAIMNLLRACGDAVGPGLTGIKCGPKGEGEDPFFQDCPGVNHIVGSEKAVNEYSDGVIAGTAWMFARPELSGQLDYLFIDEAGQVSLANLLGMSRVAENLVLIGDQMQLGQPTQGDHPGESGLSLLQYLLQNEPVVPDHIGVFLATSRRMHPEICRFISEGVYEGRLHAHASNVNRRLVLPGGGEGRFVTRDCGIIFSPVPHEGNKLSSDEEVERIREITGELLKCEYRNHRGETVGPLSIEDILYVAPYNMQVRNLRNNLPPGARVGSVDKFQGQEAPVVIVSMCSSAGDFGRRGLEFVLNRNRLNVAVSRAQSLAIIVGDPDIAHTAVSSVSDMERVNLFCRLMTHATSPRAA